MKKVLQVNKLYYPVTGGIERLVQQIAEGLKDSTDMKVLVCQPKGKGCRDVIRNVEVNRASSLGTYFSMPISFAFLRQLRKMSRDLDVIHLHMPFPLGDLGILLSGFRGKVVVSWHSDIVRQKKLMLFYRPMMNRLLQRADVILVATQGHIEGSEYLKPYRDKCVIVPYGVTPDLEEKALICPIQEKEENEPTKFLFVGRLVYYKGCDILIQALSQIPNAQLTLVGKGPLQKELEELASSLGIGQRVKFLGGLTDREMTEVFAESDVFVLPSVEKSEAFGLVQIEAMAYGKPVINTRLNSGVPYVSLDGETGITVPPKDVLALASAMEKLARDPKLCCQYGKAGRKRVKEFFSQEKMLAQILIIYEDK